MFIKYFYYFYYFIIILYLSKLFCRFMLVPFLFELRAVMDWIWTDTSMTIMDWFKMEDVFASIYQIKVSFIGNI